MRSFISAVALLVKVTARVWAYSSGRDSGLTRRVMYSTVRVKVLPLPAEAR